MNWFQHDTASTQDAKIKKLLIRHGAIGYAVYFHCLELIAADISETNLTFELEHDSEIIADNLRISGTGDKSGLQIVEEIMRTIVSLDLFCEQNGHIFCFKMIKRINLSQTSKASFRNAITEKKEKLSKSMLRHDAVMIDHDHIMNTNQPTNQPTIPTNQEDTPDKPAKSPKHKHGEYKHVLLTSDEYLRLCEEWGEPELLRMIKELDEGIEIKGYKYKNHNLALRRWKSNEKNQRNGYSKPLPVQTRTTFLDMED